MVYLGFHILMEWSRPSVSNIRSADVSFTMVQREVCFPFRTSFCTRSTVIGHVTNLAALRYSHNISVPDVYVMRQLF